MLFGFCMGSIYLLTDDYFHMWVLDKLSVYFILLYLLFMHYKAVAKTPFDKIKWVVPIIWVIACIGFNVYLKLFSTVDICDLSQRWGSTIAKSAAFRKGPIIGLFEIAFKPFIFILMYYRLYVVEKVYDLKSDPINESNIFLCLWRPNNLQAVIQTFFGLNFGGVSIYCNGNLYGFVWKKGRYVKRKTVPKVLYAKQVLIDTHIKCSNDHLQALETLIGTKARCLGLRCKCVFVIRSFLEMINPDLKPRGFQYIPSVYSKKVLKWRNQCHTKMIKEKSGILKSGRYGRLSAVFLQSNAMRSLITKLRNLLRL